MGGSDRPRRWPACALAVLFLGYAAGKAVFAWQDRLGFPGGPAVPDAVRDGYFMDAATAQWLAAATGVLAACVAIATITEPGRRAPRSLMLLVLAGMLLAVAAGAAIMIVDGFIGIGVGWQWHHGVLGIAVVGLLVAMIRSYAEATKHVVG
ncbi:hypothetical protein AB0L13_14500 [Saccharopolyspora shandongensis]|uniref:hypothetical protein n=1 Tax=Saccharopolyspora shandongensis TaxID=418495 RepID=UPI00341A4549